jgi:hypothetical protein
MKMLAKMAKLALLAAGVAILIVVALETSGRGRFERGALSTNERAITVHVVPVVRVDSPNVGSEMFVEDMLRIRSGVFTPSIHAPNLS